MSIPWTGEQRGLCVSGDRLLEPARASDRVEVVFAKLISAAVIQGVIGETGAEISLGVENLLARVATIEDVLVLESILFGTVVESRMQAAAVGIGIDRGAAGSGEGQAGKKDGHGGESGKVLGHISVQTPLINERVVFVV
jgi:hypothetical protein